MSRLRAKIDKEIENKDIKKKLRNVQARVHSNLLYTPIQTSFEKSGSLIGKTGSARRAAANKSSNLLPHSERRASPPSPKNRLAATVNASHRQTLYDETPSTFARNVTVLPHHKQPLSMYMASSFNQKPRLSNRQKKSKAKTCILPAISDNEPVEEVVKSARSTKLVRELYTPRNMDSLSSSSSEVRSRPSSSRIPVRNKPKLSARSSARRRGCVTPISNAALDMMSLSSGSTTYLNLDLDLCSLSSPKSCDDIFHMAPLIPAPSATLTSSASHTQLDTSATLIRKFRNVLAREERSMPEDDINVVKNVLKTDERVNLLKAREPDSNLFKDILKTQLDEIVKSEKVVKNALRMLGASSQVVEVSSPIEVYTATQTPGLQMDNRKAYSPRGKFKGRQQQYSSDSSPRSHSSFDGEDYQFQDIKVPGLPSSGKRRHIGTDTVSIKDFTPRNEILSAYAEKSAPRKSKRDKFTSNDGNQDEFEAFVKSTLPFKRKLASQSRSIGHQVVRRQQTLHHEEHMDFSRCKDTTRRPQVDVTFKNVPSVEKEILILKALGKRLEDTLKRSVSEPSMSENGDKDELQGCSSTSSLTRELQRIDPSIEVFPGRRAEMARTPVKPLRIAMNVVPCFTSPKGFLIFSKGLRLELGVANEFVIVSKTFNELLSESTTDFFIPNESEPGGLETIPFLKLAEQPQALMQYLKPKDPATPFNLLDQDSVFFNSFLLPGLKTKAVERSEKISIATATTTTTATTSVMNDSPVKEQPIICEGGDSLLVATDGFPAMSVEPSCSKYSTEKAEREITRRAHAKRTLKVKPPPIELPVSVTVSQRAVNRRRIHRVVTPMPADAFDDPKNNLVKTILVGAVQVSIFLVMIMAITFPDIKC